MKGKHRFLVSATFRRAGEYRYAVEAYDRHEALSNALRPEWRPLKSDMILPRSLRVLRKMHPNEVLPV